MKTLIAFALTLCSVMFGSDDLDPQVEQVPTPTYPHRVRLTLKSSIPGEIQEIEMFGNCEAKQSPARHYECLGWSIKLKFTDQDSTVNIFTRRGYCALHPPEALCEQNLRTDFSYGTPGFEGDIFGLQYDSSHSDSSIRVLSSSAAYLVGTFGACQQLLEFIQNMPIMRSANIDESKIKAEARRLGLYLLDRKNLSVLSREEEIYRPSRPKTSVAAR